MSEVYKVASVNHRAIGTTLDGDHSTGATVLSVLDPGAFTEDGGLLSIGAVELAYSGWDEDASTITLVDPLTDDAEDGEVVAVLPAGIEATATLVDDENGEPLTATIPTDLIDLLPPGPRAPEAAETVEVELAEGGVTILRILLETPSRDLSFADPDSVQAILDGSPFAADLAAVMEGLGEVTEFGWISARLVEGDVIATALSGQRVQISTAGIAAYNAAEEVTALLAAASGGLDLSGALRITGSGGIEVRGGGDILVGDSGFINIVDGGQFVNWGDDKLIQITSGDVLVKSRDEANPLGTYPMVRLAPNAIQLWRSVSSSAAITSLPNGNLTVDSSTGAAFVRGTTNAYLQATGGDAYVQSSGVTYIEGSTVRSAAIAVTTTGGAANMWVNSSTGTIARSTSSRRYKRDETTWRSDGRNLLDLVGKRYRDRGEFAEDPDARWYANLIAEDLHDAGFTEFVVYDDQGRPDNIMEGRLMAVAGLDAIRALDARLTAVEDAA